MEFILIDTIEKLERLSENYPKTFAFDTETTGVDISVLQLVGISLYEDDLIETPIFIPFNFYWY